MANDIIRCRRSRAAEQAPKWKIGSRFFPRLSHYLRNEYNGNGPPPYAWYPALQQKLKPQLKLLFLWKTSNKCGSAVVLGKSLRFWTLCSSTNSNYHLEVTATVDYSVCFSIEAPFIVEAEKLSWLPFSHCFLYHKQKLLLSRQKKCFCSAVCLIYATILLETQNDQSLGLIHNCV